MGDMLLYGLPAAEVTFFCLNSFSLYTAFITLATSVAMPREITLEWPMVAIHLINQPDVRFEYIADIFTPQTSNLELRSILHIPTAQSG